MSANWPIGYGLVNYWHTVDPVPFAKALKKAGCNLTAIEWVPWFDVKPCSCKKTGGSSLYGGCAKKPHPKLAQKFVYEMSKRGITTLVIQENRNSCACRAEDDAYRASMLKKILKLQEHGSIWYEPFSEPWVKSAGTEQFVKYARSIVPIQVPFVIPDKERHVPIKQPYWSNVPFSYLDVHPDSDAAVMAGLRKGHPVLVNSDCTGTLNPGPTRARVWAKESARTKTGLHIYDFRGKTPDLAVISVLGEVINGSI